MFIYKITVIPTGQVYIGLDTKPVYKKARWKAHCKKSAEVEPRYKIHKAMKEYGIENCSYEVVESGFQTVGKLALAEIENIQKCNSYRNGLNSSLGGDGLGKNDLVDLSYEEILQIKNALGDHWREWNRKKWSDTTPEQRKQMIKNAFLPEVNARRADSLKEYYKSCPEAIESRREKMRISRNQNKEVRDQQAKEAGLKGAAKMSKSILVEFPDGTRVTYKSKSEMQRQTKLWATTLLRKTSQGKTSNGHRAWEL